MSLTSTGVLDQIERDSEHVNRLLGVDDESVTEYAEFAFGQNRSFDEMVDFSNEMEARIIAGDTPLAEKHLAIAALVVSPTIRHRKLSRELQALSQAASGLHHARSVVPRLASEFLDDDTRRVQYVRDDVSVNPRLAIGMHGEKYGALDEDTLSWDLHALGNIVDKHGKNGFRKLRNTYGVERYGRYALGILHRQLSTPHVLPEHMSEMPIFVTQYDSNGAFFRDGMYDQIEEITDTPAYGLVPRIYESHDANEFLSQLEQPDKPAFGVISAHGDYAGLSFAVDDGFELRASELDKLVASNPTRFEKMRRVWAGAGGIVVATCSAARSMPNANIVRSFVSAMESSAIASTEPVDDVLLKMQRSRGRLTLSVALSSIPDATRLFTYSKKTPNQSFQIKPDTIPEYEKATNA